MSATAQKNEERYLFSSSRQSRLLFALLVMLFSIVPILMGIFEQDAGLLLLLGLAVFSGALYALLCVSVLTVDPGRKVISTGKSCLLFKTAKIYPFDAVREVGIRESHYSHITEEEGGIFYRIEFRTLEKKIVVPGTASKDKEAIVQLTRQLANQTGIRSNLTPRKQFTGQWVLTNKRKDKS